mgnify:CR=1 FL=1
MGWSSAFVAGLESRTIAFCYVLEVVQIYNEPGNVWSVGSHPGLGMVTGLGLRGISVQGSTLSARTWSSTIGAFTVELVGDIQELCKNITRGTVVTLRAGFEGMAVYDFERIALGQVRNLRGTAPSWTLECVDLLTLCRVRLQRTFGNPLLFDSIGNTTTLGANYTAGDGTVTVASTASFEREAGGTGAFLVTPSVGDPFYLTYTGTTATTFTGCSTTGQMGTTAVNAVATDVVTEVAYLSAHPLNIARRVLVSRDGTNGSWDDYPAAWGLGMDSTMLDHDDIDAYQSLVVVPASGQHNWEYTVHESESDALAWLQAFLARAGLFVTSRQGALTIRGVQHTQTPTYTSGLAITDADIEEIEDYEAWDATDHPTEYHTVLVNSATGGTSNPTLEVATLPYESTNTYDLTDRVFANESAVRTEVLGRVLESAQRIPERLGIRCAGLRLAQLAPGDVVPLTTRRTHSRRDGPAGWKEAPAEVIEVSPSWTGGTVRLGLLVYPPTDDVLT